MPVLSIQSKSLYSMPPSTRSTQSALAKVMAERPVIALEHLMQRMEGRIRRFPPEARQRYGALIFPAFLVTINPSFAVMLAGIQGTTADSFPPESWKPWIFPTQRGISRFKVSEF